MIGVTPLQIDVGTRSVTAAHTALAVSLLVGTFVLLTVARYKMQFVGLSDEQQRQKKHLLGQREDQDPETLRIPVSDHGNLEQYRNQIRALFDADLTVEDVSEHTTLRDAFTQVRQELGEAWRSRTSHLPKLAVALGELAVAIAVTGGIATTSAETFRRWFTSSSDGLNLNVLASVAIETASEAVAVGIDVLGAFPFAETLWSLIFAYGLLGLQWLYDHPFVSASILALATVLVVYLDRRAPDAVDASLVGSRSSIALGTVACLIVIWLSGIVLAVLGDAVGYPQIGAVAGLTAAVGFTVYFGYHAAVLFRDRVRSVASDLSSEDHLTAAYLVLRRAAAGYAGLVAPLVPVYLGVALVSGKLGALITAYLNGSLERQAVVSMVILLGLAVVARQAQAAYPDVKAATQELVARQSVRAVLFGRGVPIIVVVLAYFLSVGFGFSAGLSAVIAVAAGITTRLLYVLVLRARYRASLIESHQRLPSRVVVQGYQFETADGETVYYAAVNATELAHRDRDELVDEILDASDELFASGEISPSVAQEFAEDLFEFGIVDVEETRTKLRRQVREETVGRLRQNGEMLEQETLEDELEEYPASIWEQCLREWRVRGEVKLRNGYYLLVE